MKKSILSLILALALGMAAVGCERQRDQAGESADEGISDMKRSGEDATEHSKNSVDEGARDVKRSAEDAAD